MQSVVPINYYASTIWLHWYGLVHLYTTQMLGYDMLMYTFHVVSDALNQLLAQAFFFSTLRSKWIYIAYYVDSEHSWYSNNNWHKFYFCFSNLFLSYFALYTWWGICPTMDMYKRLSCTHIFDTGTSHFFKRPCIMSTRDFANFFFFSSSLCCSSINLHGSW